MRKPYQTLTRARASLYLRECLTAKRQPNISEAVRKGVAGDRKSARRAIRFVMEHEFAPCTAV